MQYLELVSGDITICYHNSWTGVETVEINGQTYSKQSSIMGLQHQFDVKENGILVHYQLTSRLGNDGNVLVDLLRDGIMIHKNVIVPYTTKPKSPAFADKQEGLKKLKMYDIDQAIDEFKKALKKTPNDPEIYFHLACAYSNKEMANEGLSCLVTAIEKGLKDTEMILSHEMLSYLRMQPGFEHIQSVIKKM
ncbi:MAG TPA: tetratricopeptide repeat protein, partial [Saprospiraceae bacterium]|nr:tetratricopeptide repeat protein [Saprospiraceae bacterium]MBK7699843.1 tetratricopeptide repeat protein [Saprospiraceae bacterium]HQV66809.1 tetratricopeptide repeat protein [Saprospiraceae bacterium]HRG40672.1 tetratricopeptide repeat protein [Saprospiraceae bacterium]